MNNLLKIFILKILVFLCFDLHAEITNNENSANNTYSVLGKRSFVELDPFINISSSEGQSFFMEDIYDVVSAEDEQTRLDIDATLAQVVASNNFVKFLDSNALMELPIGIKKTVGALEYIILIDSVVSTAEHSMLYASMSFETPKMGRIHFRGEGIKFSKKGGIVGGGVLYLVGDYPSQSKLDAEKEKTQFVIRGSNNKTFVEFDCAGFKQFSLDGSLVFSNKTIQPEDASGNIIEGKNVAVDFVTSVTDWNNILLEVSIDPFQVKGLKDVSFEVAKAVIDLSDSRNSPGVNFPAEYVQQSSYHQSGTPELWRGVFISSLTVSLPHQFDTATSTNGVDGRVKLIGRDMLIDDMGFTGIISGQNLIPLEKGKLGKWKFALDELSIKVVVNELTEGSIKGKMDIPVRKGSDTDKNTDESKLFAYSAMIKPGGEYLFNVSMPENLEFDLFNAANVTLLPSSYVKVEIKDDKFLPSANLNGQMDIKVGLNSEDGTADSNKKKNVSLNSIKFENLNIRSEKPYVSVGYFSLGISSSGMGGFPIQINEISGGQDGDELFLGVALTLQLTGNADGGGGFGAEGAFRIYTKADDSSEKIKYRYDRIEIQKLSIDISQGDAFSFKGKLIFFKNDPIYGNGISGSVEAKFSEFGLTANAVFGTVEGTKYWYVDAMVDLGNGIPVFTGFFLTRFGGGAYYHMALDNKGVGSEIGTTTSGVTYIPDKSVGIGLKAIVGIVGGNEKGFSAEVTFEMAFRTSGGLKYIRFMGKFSMMSIPIEVPPAVLKAQAMTMASEAGNKSEISNNANASKAILGDDRGDASIFGVVIIELNFDDKSLHANLDLDINVAGGVITGGGNAVMHFSNSEWYIYVGRPEKENRINLNIMSIIRVDAYFVMGSVVPDSPPPPQEVSEILGGIDLDYMSDLNALADGAGIGFGASLSIDTGDKSFLIFYGRFTVGLGFDVMLKDYGNATCAGRGQIGIDGWYANGQSYAYFDGVVGIRVKVFKKKKSIDILNIAAAVVLQAQLPNPVWMKGIVGGQYSVLGGMVKGECKFEVEIGEQCDMSAGSSADALEGLEIIAQLTPGEGAQEVDVFTLPQMVFNYEINKSYRMVEETQTIQFRIAAKEMSIKYNGQVLPTTVQWSDDKMTAVLESDDLLPPESSLVVTASTVFEEFKDGTWKTVKAEDGSELVETKTVTFTTGVAPDYIVPSNVSHQYPLEDMVNYYPEEYPTGFVMLKRDQGYLFEDPEYEAKARFQNGSDSKETTITYSSSQKEVRFAIPTDLKKDRVYTVTIISIPTVSTDMEANVSATSSSVDLGGDGGEIEMTAKSAEGSVQGYEEKQLFKSYFRVSKYATFKLKAAVAFGSGGWRDPIEVNIHRIGTNLSGDEQFAYRELKEVDGAPPLILLEADLKNNAWYNRSVLSIMYENYPLVGNVNVSFSHRSDVSVLGTPPSKAVYIWQYPYIITMSENARGNGYMSLSAPAGTLSYMLVPRMREDYDAASNMVAGAYSGHGSISSKAKTFLEGSFPKIKKGDYWVTGKYNIPGRNVVSSTYRHKINNPLD
ncbi:MAG: hypothetical protein OCD76_06710 [Reichenbachiella sp.]